MSNIHLARLLIKAMAAFFVASYIGPSKIDNVLDQMLRQVDTYEEE